MKKNTVLLLLLLSCQQLFADTFNIASGDIQGLINAINSANANTEADVINLDNNGTYVFSNVHTTVTGFGAGYIETNGPVALPVILNTFSGSGPDLVINLNGSILSLSSSGARMRLFQGDSDASFQINGGTIKDFESPANNPSNGQGGAGAAVVVGQRCTFSSDGMTFDNCKSNSREERAGGAISIGGSSTTTLKNCTFKNNSSGSGANSNGGAITALHAEMYLENCVFENNTTPNANGGAVYIDGTGDSTVEFVNCSFTNNIAGGGGSDIYGGGALFLQAYFLEKYIFRNCQFTNNKSKKGGAILQYGTNSSEFIVSGSTFEGNESFTHGGASEFSNGKNRFTNCTFYGNKAGADASGGALFNYTYQNQSHYTTIENCTFASNTSGGYGGAWVINDGKGIVKNSIIVNNTCSSTYGNNCFNALTDGGNNIEYPENTNGFKCFPRAVASNANSLPVIDPLLLPLANNGGPTKTVALQAGSPAINAGSGCTAADQRGVARVGTCDIGAFEYQPTLPVTLINFAVKKSVSGVDLTWKTAAENKSSHFELLHATDVSGFKMIANITSTGNATTGENYSFKHAQPVNGNNYYKLIQFDKNGERTEFEVKSVQFQLGAADEEVSLFPNPASHVVTTKFAANIYTKLEVLDMFGKVVISKKIGASDTEVELDVAQLASGNYVVALSTMKNKKDIRKFIKL